MLFRSLREKRTAFFIFVTAKTSLVTDTDISCDTMHVSEKDDSTQLTCLNGSGQSTKDISDTHVVCIENLVAKGLFGYIAFSFYQYQSISSD